MKHSMGTIVAVIIPLLAVMAWAKTLQTFVQREQKPENTVDVDALVQKAQQYESQEIYYDASLLYEQALEAQPDNYEIALKYADMLKIMGMEDQYLSACERAMTIDPQRCEAYQNAVQLEIDSGDYAKATEYFEQARTAGVQSDLLTTQEQTLKDAVAYKGVTALEVGTFYYGNAAIREEDGWGIVSYTGSMVIPAVYDEIGMVDPDTEFVPVCEEGHWYYRDVQGYKRREPQGAYRFLGTFVNGVAAACDESGMYGYINTDMQQIRPFAFSYAGGFANGVAAVQKDGKWALINEQFTELTDYEYDEILLDRYGFCTGTGFVFARKGEKWVLLDNTGARIGKEEYDQVSAVSGNKACVQKNQEWCLIDTSGNTLQSYQLEGARGYGNGLFAATQDGETWYYAQENGEPWHKSTIPAQDLTNVLSNGIFFEKNGDIWQMEQLYYLP